MLNLHVKMLRDAENAKFGLKAHGKASSSKENEVMVVLYFMIGSSVIAVKE